MNLNAWFLRAASSYKLQQIYLVIIMSIGSFWEKNKNSKNMETIF